MQRKLQACKYRLADLDRVFVAAHNALQLPCFRRKKATFALPDRWYWYHSRMAYDSAICDLEIALRNLEWDLPYKTTVSIERIYTQAQQEIRQLAKSWHRYMNMVNRLARIHNHKKYSIPFPDGDLTQRYQ